MAQLDPSVRAKSRLAMLGDRIAKRVKPTDDTAEIASILEDEIIAATDGLALDVYNAAELTSRLTAFGFRLVARIRNDVTAAIVEEAWAEVDDMWIILSDVLPNLNVHQGASRPTGERC